MRNKLFSFLTACGLASTASAMDLHVNVHDLVSNAHVIVVATCTGTETSIDPVHPKMVWTTARFIGVSTMRVNVPGTAPTDGTLALHFLGGSVGNLHMLVCDMPRFKAGERYVLFLVNDGVRYLTPLVGGDQGMLKVLHDPATGTDHITDANRHGITGVEEGEWLRTRPIVNILGGVIDYAPKRALADDGHAEEEAFAVGLPITLEGLQDLVHAITYDEPSFNRHLTTEGLMPHLNLEAESEAEFAAGNDQRGPLAACLHQDVYIWFEENGNVPGYGSQWAAIEDYSKAIWDVHINIFSDDPNPTDGYQFGNGESEIAGWLSSAQTQAAYGFSWPPFAAAKIMYYATSLNSGGVITEADIMMRDGLIWTTDWSVAASSNAINYRNIIMHEMGHAWGYQTGNCNEETYDYAYPSVMHKYYFGGIWEDGKEIHARDAQVIRALYDDQATVKPMVDLGVESYRALDGSELLNSYAVPSSVTSGGPITVHRFTVENNSTTTRNNVRLRYYLSTNRTLTNSDHLVATKNLGNMAAVSRKVASGGHSLDTDGVPPGWYYIGAKVTHNGNSYDDDDRPANDITWTTYQVQILPSVGVAEIAQAPAFSIYPNPTSGEFIVEFEDGAGHGTLRILDATGRSVRELAIENEETLSVDLAAVPIGLYMTEFVSRSGSRWTQRLVRQ